MLQVSLQPSGLVLVADIGGSTSRFGLAARGERPRQVVTVSNATVTTLEFAIAQYLEHVGVRPAAAIFAVAGPIGGEEVALTNRAWRFRPADLAARFGFDRIQVVNDFEALAWALPVLGAADIRAIGQSGEPDGGTKLVVGPGTGLGVAALVRHGGRWFVVASEGGHAYFGPGRPEEIPIFDRLWRDYGCVSAEMVLSGAGLHRLYRAVSGGPALPDAETIVAMAKAGDPAARGAAVVFLRLLGRFAGSLALTFKATGGVYIAGGVAVALGALLPDGEFRSAFETHPPHQGLLTKIPTSLITCREPGLLGCCALIENLEQANDTVREADRKAAQPE